MRFKITPPVASPHAVERTQVLDRVAQCVGIRLVLVRAPAGYGKTTTLAQLHRRLVALDVDCVWLQFDEADNDVSRFVASVRHALVGAASRTTRRAARDESDPAEMPLAAISRRRMPFALFIDDMEAVSSPAVLALVAGMIVRLPP